MFRMGLLDGFTASATTDTSLIGTLQPYTEYGLIIYSGLGTYSTPGTSLVLVTALDPT